jgi:predicted DNA-binding protein
MSRLRNTLPVRMPEDLFERIAGVARATGLTRSDVLRMAVRSGIGEIEAGKIRATPDAAAPEPKPL